MKRAFVIGFVLVLACSFSLVLAGEKQDCRKLYRQGKQEIEHMEDARDDYLEAYEEGDEDGMREASNRWYRHQMKYVEYRIDYGLKDCEDILGKSFPFPGDDANTHEIPGF